MKRLLGDFLICPSCLPEENRLFLKADAVEGDDVLTGSLSCGRCGACYLIAEGIADMLPAVARPQPGQSGVYESAAMVSSYLWSHYADLLDDPDATGAYTQWAVQIRRDQGFFLDAGCAVGRFTFEMSRKSDLAVGVDNSLNFVRAARALAARRSLTFPLKEEGHIMKESALHLPESWEPAKVEFLLADAQALPFPRELFSCVASLNLVDRVSRPLHHLMEVNRVAGRARAQFLFSDPFSWSSQISSEKDWLGGTEEGPWAGNGLANIASILEGRNGWIVPPWTIENSGGIWWKVRNHRNHFELIRSCFIKAGR